MEGIIKHKIYKSSERKHRENTCGLGLGKYFLDMKSKSWSVKKKA